MKTIILITSLFLLISCNDKSLVINEDKSNSNTQTISNVVTFETHIKPLVEKSCNSCHGNGQKGTAKDWSIYESAKNGIDKIIPMVMKGQMPQGAPLPKEEKMLFIQWKQAGLLEFPPADSGKSSAPIGPRNRVSEKVYTSQAQRIVETQCLSCHQSDNTSELVPIIEGQNADYLLEQIEYFKFNDRNSHLASTMNTIFINYNEIDIADIAYELSNRSSFGKTFSEYEEPSEETIELVLNGYEVYKKYACASCHDRPGQTGKMIVPQLIGQKTDYILYSLQMFKAQARPADYMDGLTKEMTNSEMKAVAAFIGSIASE